MTDNKKYKKGTLGWLREQAKKDGFDNIRDWQNWKRKDICATQQRVVRKWTKNEIYDLIRQFNDRTGRVPIAADFDSNPKYPSVYMVQNLCGSWNNGIRDAGLQPYCFTNITDGELLDFLEIFNNENGRPPTARDFMNNSKYPEISQYIRYFGSFEKAKKISRARY